MRLILFELCLALLSFFPLPECFETIVILIQSVLPYGGAQWSIACQTIQISSILRIFYNDNLMINEYPDEVVLNFIGPADLVFPFAQSIR